MLARVGLLKGHPAKSLVSLTTRGSSVNSPCVDNNEKSLYRRLVRPEVSKVRLGFLPDEWFTFFYKKTGVTGPYTFGIAFTTYLVSKEFYVLEHEYYNGISLFLLLIIGIKKFGPMVAAYLDKEIDEYEAGHNARRVTDKERLEFSIKSEEQNQWSSEGQLMLVDAKRENVALQLEAAYRQRLMTVYADVKNRLDYQLARNNTERRIAQKHLVSWVIKQVLGSITSEQEKQNIDKCIADLAVLAKA